MKNSTALQSLSKATSCFCLTVVSCYLILLLTADFWHITVENAVKLTGSLCK